MSLIPVTAFPRGSCSTLFQTNDVPNSSLQADPRVLYAAFVPDEHYPQSPSDPTRLPLLVAVHGTGRHNNRYLDTWREFGINNRCCIVAPLFPCLVTSATDIDGYHYLGRQPASSSSVYEKIMESKVEVPKIYAKVDGPDVRYDLLLLAILDEVAIRWPAIDTSKILMTGFSGGGQFVHRFMYLHPDRLLAVNVGAPGSVTHLNIERPWPAGIQDVEDVFGQCVDVEAIGRLPIMVSVGGEDKIENVSKARRLIKGDSFGSEEEVNKTRVQKATELVEQWRRLSLNVEFEVVPGAKHEMGKVNVVVEPFMKRQVDLYRKGKMGHG